MRDDDARKLDRAPLEAFRIRGVSLVQKGESPEVVGKALGLNRTTIYGWLAMTFILVKPRTCVFLTIMRDELGKNEVKRRLQRQPEPATASA